MSCLKQFLLNIDDRCFYPYLARASRDNLRVLVIDPGEDLAEVENRISNALKIQGVRVPKIYVDKVDFIPKDKSGKSPLVKRYKP